MIAVVDTSALVRLATLLPDEVDSALGVPAVRYPIRGLVDRMWALRHDLGAYDAAFMTLAEVVDAPLVTCDTRQATASGHRARVEAY